MKKIITLAIATILLFSIACGGGDSEEPQAASDTPTGSGTVASEIPIEPTAVSPTNTPEPTPVATVGEFFLQLVEPAETEVFTDTAAFSVLGRTRVDAVVTINDTIVEPNIDGEFSLDMTLEEGPNIIEVVASVASGEQEDLVLVAIYIP